VEFESPHRATAPPSRRGTRQWLPRRASPTIKAEPTRALSQVIRAGRATSVPVTAVLSGNPSPETPHLTGPLSARVRLLAVEADNLWSGWPRQTAPRPGPAPLPAASRSVNSSRGTLRRHAGLRADMVDSAYGAHPVALPMITTCLRRRQRGPLRPGRIASRFADHPSPLVPWVQGVTGGGPLKRSEAWVLDICYEA
jgi:hypothetical protein